MIDEAGFSHAAVSLAIIGRRLFALASRALNPESADRRFRRRLLSICLPALVLALLIAGALHLADATPVTAGAAAANVAAPPDGAPLGESRVPKRFAEPLRHDPLWVEVDIAAVPDPPPYADEWSTRGRVLVRLSGASAAARRWRRGDRLAIPLPQLGATYLAVIEEIDDGAAARTFLARTAGAGGGRRCILTIGPTSVFAYIDTPRGPYELLADQAFGWLAPSSSLGGRHLGEPAGARPGETVRR